MEMGLTWLSIVCLLFLQRGIGLNCTTPFLFTIISSTDGIVFFNPLTFYCCNFLRISITFRRMDESKRPTGFVPEPDLQGIQPLSYEEDKAQKLNASKPEYHMKKQSVRRAVNTEARGSAERSYTHIEPREPTWSRRGPANRRRVGLNLSS